MNVCYVSGIITGVGSGGGGARVLEPPFFFIGGGGNSMFTPHLIFHLNYMFI